MSAFDLPSNVGGKVVPSVIWISWIETVPPGVAPVPLTATNVVPFCKGTPADSTIFTPAGLTAGILDPVHPCKSSAVIANEAI